MKKILLALSMTGVSLISVANAETKLTLSSWLPPTHPIVTDMIKPWMAQVKEATEGRVTVQMLAKPLGHPKIHYDVARDGMADVSYSVHGYTPGRFSLTKIAELPFTGDSAEAISVAYWKIHEKYLAKAKEHKGTQLLSLFAHGPGMIHNSKHAVNNLDDLSGLKIRVGGGVVSDVAKKLGVTALLKPASASYEILSRGVADGIFFPMESLISFKIDKIVTHTTLVPGGLYNTSFFLVMNKERFSRLSQADQEAIMRVSGEAFARLAGKAWDNVDKKALALVKKNGNQVQTADANLIQSIKDKTQVIETDWVKQANKKGIDGEKVLAEFRAMVDEYQPAKD